MSRPTNYLVVSTDFSSASLGSLAVDSCGNLPSLAFVKIPLLRGALFHPSGIAYTIATDASNTITGFAATVSNVTPSAIVQAHVDTRVGGAFNSWTNGLAANNVLDLSFNFKTRTTAMRVDVLNASGLVGVNSIGQHIAFLATNALLFRKPASTTEAISSATLAALVSSVNTQVATRLGQVLGTQPVQDAILKALVAANGPVIDPLATRLPYDAAYSGLELVLYLQNFSCSVTFPGQLAQNITFDRLPVQVSII